MMSDLENIGLSDGVFIEEIHSGELNVFLENQTWFEDGFVRFQPSGQLLPREFIKYEKTIKDLEVFESDIWISSFPNCGTTWCQEMVWNIVNNLDFETAKSKSLDKRIPFLELSALMGEKAFENFSAEDKSENEAVVASIEYCKHLTSKPRILKTHLHFEMLPDGVKEKKPKVIYIARNPRDVVVSFYNHWRVLAGFTGIKINLYSDWNFLKEKCRNFRSFL